jgi:hypothetical protein
MPEDSSKLPEAKRAPLSRLESTSTATDADPIKHDDSQDENRLKPSSHGPVKRILASPAALIFTAIIALGISVTLPNLGPVISRDFRRFLNAIDDNLPLAEKSNLADPATTLCIYEATNGVVANVMKLIRRATVIALESNSEILTFEILSLSYEQWLAANNPSKPNPFDAILHAGKK